MPFPHMHCLSTRTLRRELCWNSASAMAGRLATTVCGSASTPAAQRRALLCARRQVCCLTSPPSSGPIWLVRRLSLSLLSCRCVLACFGVAWPTQKSELCCCCCCCLLLLFFVVVVVVVV